MDRIAGIDVSLTSTGLAVITRRTDGTTLATTTTITSRGRRADGLPERNTRIDTLAAAIDHAAGPCGLAVVEGPSHGSKGGSPLDRHHLWWLVVSGLLARGIPVAVCAPATRARFATGSGRADKAAVSAAISRCWPELDITNADEADALTLAHSGAVALEWSVVTLQRHRDALAAIRWPAGWERTSPAPSGGANGEVSSADVLR